MKRRSFFTLLGGVVAVPSQHWPLAAHAQQPALPVIGFLARSPSADAVANFNAIRQGLNEMGFVQGQNITIESRFADDQYNRLPDLAADLVHRQVVVIITSGNLPSLAAKAATATIPIVFAGGFDPVEIGVVASLARPGGNITGVSWLANALEAKRLGLIRVLVPRATVITALINPDNASAKAQSRDLTEAARALGLQLHVDNARSERDFDTVFATAIQQRAGALLIGTDGFFTSHREQLVALAARYAIPTIYNLRDFAEAGGLMSYGASNMDAFRQAGVYAARILKGAKPADLPVMLPTKFELIINLKTAKGLGLTVPDGLLLAADEVIE